MNGIFLTLEGGEGCGKSTQLELVAEALRAKSGREVVTARSPGGTAVAEKIRVRSISDPQTVTYYYEYTLAHKTAPLS